MVLNTKGVTLRLSNSSDFRTVQSSILSISVLGAFLSSDTAIIDFITIGFTEGMRFRTNSSNNTGVYTIRAVSPDGLNVLESTDFIVQDNSTTLSFTGYNMEEIGEVVSIDGPAGSVNVIDITNLGSTAREKLVGIQDEGQVTMEVLSNFTTGSTGINQWKLRDLRQAGTKSFFDIRFTDVPVTTVSEPSAYFFEGFVTNYANAVALDDAVKASIGLEISSQAHFMNGIAIV